MLLFVMITLLVMKMDYSFGNAIGNSGADRQLLMSFILNRHGERTPAEEEAALSRDRYKLEPFISVEGYEGLTNEGKKRAYQIGKFIRSRYGSNEGFKLLSDIYLQNEISIRSTDKERTKMTALIAMSALYPPRPRQQWDGGLGSIWQPVPYTAVPLSEDYLRFYSNCKPFKLLLELAKQDAVKNEFLEYEDLIPLLKKETGADFLKDPLLFETYYDLLHSMRNLGLELPEWTEPLMPRLTEAARLAYRLYFRTEEMKKYGGGVLLNDFITTSDKIVSGDEDYKRVHYFSSHDFNIGALMETARVRDGETENLIFPEYGSVFALELYRSRQTGEYSVLPIYLQQAGATVAPVELKIDGCDETYCDFNLFKQLTQNYVLPEREYYRQCKLNTEL